jgi:hypothetical protein
MNPSPPRILQEEIKKLGDLTHKWLAAQTPHHEKYKQLVGQIFQNVNDATMSFQVRILLFIHVLLIGLRR